MEELNKLIEKYMQFDKKTLAELLALKEIKENSNNLTLNPGTVPVQPNPYPYNPNPNYPGYGFPYVSPTWPGDYTITCHVG